MTAEAIAALLHARRAGPGKWMAKCPSHDDRAASLSIGEGNDGKILLRCFAGCEFGAIVKAAGLKESDLFPASTQRPRSGLRLSAKCGELAAFYDYTDESGELLYQVVRYRDPKSFRQRRPNGQGGWSWRTEGVHRALFRLPEVLKATDVFICEGEKDCLNLQAALDQLPDAAQVQRVATTASGGANAPWLPTYSASLAGKNVTVLPDNDAPGRAHAQKVATALNGIAASVRVVALPGLPEKGDVSDYLEGHSATELLALAQAAPLWTAPVAPPPPPTPTPEELAAATQKLAGVTGELLGTCKDWIRRYVILNDAQSTILAAWVLHGYALDAAETTPYVHITAPEKMCGKSRLVEALAAISANPINSSGMTPAALVRTIEAKAPVLYLDEMDAQLGGNKEYAETVRGILDAGFRRGGVLYKCDGANFELKAFNVFCAKCFAGIGQLPDTVSSRSITIELRRKLRSETIKPFRQKAITLAAAPVKAALESWVGQRVAEVLQKIEPAPIASLSDRQNDIAEPLLCIAQFAGNGWLQKLTGALQMVFGAAGVEDTSIGGLLLADIRAIFDERKIDTLSSKDLAESLCTVEGRLWPEWSHGRGLSANNLARQLRRFAVYPRPVRTGGEVFKGYHRSDFEDAFARYCPLPPISTVTQLQPASSLAEPPFSNGYKPAPVTVAKSAPDPHKQRVVTAVTVAKPEYGPQSEIESFSEGPSEGALPVENLPEIPLPTKKPAALQGQTLNLFAGLVDPGPVSPSELEGEL